MQQRAATFVGLFSSAVGNPAADAEKDIFCCLGGERESGAEIALVDDADIIPSSWKPPPAVSMVLAHTPDVALETLILKSPEISRIASP